MDDSCQDTCKEEPVTCEEVLWIRLSADLSVEILGSHPAQEALLSELGAVRGLSPAAVLTGVRFPKCPCEMSRTERGLELAYINTFITVREEESPQNGARRSQSAPVPRDADCSSSEEEGGGMAGYLTDLHQRVAAFQSQRNRHIPTTPGFVGNWRHR
ncbi:hypothetical protein AK812_SmicGene41181 [Symbiodinium microadriaticum]|uniref:Uncharacterized protein n=1 Tax=Symbiodinium microadriaticum TaxID=2951 RepID=A0A1Q9C6R5_SYMMI|nr:hypothetical protein AK812_SmicGene41181 [Symbiodinium microadriaticum]